MRMTDKRLEESLLDAAIDRAVREMTNVEPRDDLRRRVLADLAGQPARAPLWPRLAFGSVALAVVAVFVFMFVNRPTDPAVEQAIVRSQPPAVAPGSAARARQPATGTAPMAADRTRGRGVDPKAGTVARRPVAEDRRVQAASIDTAEPIAIEPMTPVEQLTPVDPIGIAKLEAPRVSTSEISIRPLTIERIEITPLTPPR